MAYKPNPNRKVVNGKAVVSAKELADFQAERGSDKTLRDLLNADKGLSRKKEPEDIKKSTDEKGSMSRQSGPPTTTQGATYSKPSIEEGGVKPKNRSSWDETGFERAKRGESPLNDAIMYAGKLAIAAIPAGKVLSAARPLVGAAAQSFKESLKDLKQGNPPQRFSAERDVDIPFEQAVNKVGAAQMARELQYETGVKDLPNTNPDKEYAKGQGFLGRTKDEFLNRKKGGLVKQYTKSGKINLDACGVSTHVPNKKNSNW